MRSSANRSSDALRVGTRVRTTVVAAALAAFVTALALIGAASASAADPGRWTMRGWSPLPLTYWQGMTSDPAGQRLYFDGISFGLYRTDNALTQTASRDTAIPGEVAVREGYNHIGDISWDRAEGGRVLLPLECYVPGVGNTCGTGAVGVADPASLAWRYYVKLDPAFIKKAMWNEVSPDDRLLWTSEGDDLLAYSVAEITRANAAPAGPLLRPTRILRDAVPPSGITGAVFHDDRLLLAGEDDGAYQVWSVDVNTGARRLEIELDIAGESEGLDVVAAKGGLLHYLVAPIDGQGRQPTFGFGHTALLHFVPTDRLTVRLAATPSYVRRGVRTRLRFQATMRAGAQTGPVPGARIRFAGRSVTADANGVATMTTTRNRLGRETATATSPAMRAGTATIRVLRRPRSAGPPAPPAPPPPPAFTGAP